MRISICLPERDKPAAAGPRRNLVGSRIRILVG